MRLKYVVAASMLGAALLMPFAIAPASAQTGTRMKAPTAAPMNPQSKAGTGMMKHTGQTVNINTASAAELDSLPQIGPKRAAKIIAGRPYKSPDDLVTKKVLGQGIYNKIKDRITS